MCLSRFQVFHILNAGGKLSCLNKKTEGVLPSPSLRRVNPRKNKMPITKIATAPTAKYKGNLFLEPPTS